jgi:peptide deformylase
MKLPVHKYGDPILRKKGALVTEVTPEIHKLIAAMFETMEAHHGVGLAAQQVGHALQLTVIDIRPIEDRPSTLHLDGKPADPNSINPVVLPVGEPVAGPEGCLSFPKIYGDVERPESVDVTATNEKGEKVSFRAGGLLARCVQHETDHLNGILFIDRMGRETKEELKPDLDDLQAATKAALKKGKK